MAEVMQILCPATVAAMDAEEASLCVWDGGGWGEAGI